MRKLLDQLPARTLPFEPDKSQPNIAVNDNSNHRREP